MIVELIFVKEKIVLSPLDKVDKNILSVLEIINKRKCHCRTKWQHRAEWL